jgi:hypothetical protein
MPLVAPTIALGDVLPHMPPGTVLVKVTGTLPVQSIGYPVITPVLGEYTQKFFATKEEQAPLVTVYLMVV